jgi:diaminopimelate epimerase
MDYTKAHGTANDFVVLADTEDRLDVPAHLVRALTDRRRGVGADGVIRLGGVADGYDGDVFMDYRNADGSAVEMCGNGVRVTAKYAVDHGLVAPRDDGTVVVATRSGPKPVRIVARNDDGTVAEVAVDMGPPLLDAPGIPFDPAATDGPAPDDGDAPGEPADRHRIVVDGRPWTFAAVSMGNPHAIIRVDDVTTAPVADLGPRIETHPAFPARTNVEFVQVVDRGHVRLRVWERGVGETAACGTGACATVVALHRAGLVDDEVAVSLPGGTLRIHWHPGATVTMTGPAVEVGHGTLDEAWLRDALAGRLETAP